MLKSLSCLLAGGALGAMARWGLHYGIDSRLAGGASFPWGILVVNTLGCFLFGWLFTLFQEKSWFSDAIQLAVFTGFLGSFTTFSTFGWNTVELLRTGQVLIAFANVGASVILGLLAVWGGILLAR